MTLDDARYLSPEQAIGEPAGPESDVYALALILFEAVTGSAAFEGTTAEAILRARLDAPLPVRLELGTLDMVLAQAAVPDPRLRLDAEQFSARLGAVVGDEAPLVLRSGARRAAALAVSNRSEPRNSIGFRPPSAEQVDRDRSGRSPAARSRARRVISARARTGRLDTEAARQPLGRRRDSTADIRPARAPSVAVGLSRRGPRARRPGLGARRRSGRWARSSESHTVPTSTGLDGLTQASTAARKSDGFILSMTRRRLDRAWPVHDIISQSPVAGPAKAGSGRSPWTSRTVPKW